MRYFYIDTENVQTYSFANNWRLSEDDTVVVFVSPNSKNIRFEDLQVFTNTKSTFIYEQVTTGEKNAMDFAMVTELAIRALENPNTSHYIVSDDCGFITSIEYLNKRLNNKSHAYIIKPKVDTELWNLLKKHNNKGLFHNALVAKYGNEMKKQVYETYRDIFDTIKEDEQIQNDLNIIMNDSTDCRCYRNALRKHFGNEKGNELYWETKEEYLKLKNK